MIGVGEWFTTWRNGVLRYAQFTRSELSLGVSQAWRFTDTDLSRADERFFSVIGIRSEQPEGTTTQPIIFQPEIGLLAFAVRRRNAQTEWLMQCKIEPGNTHGAQLAPTVQATRSNIERAHAGAPTPLVDDITKAPMVLARGNWSEQGALFFGKHNENRTVIFDDDIAIPDSDVYRWVAASDVRVLLTEEYAINTDARSVLATGPWDLLASSPRGPFHGELRASYHAADRGVGRALDTLAHLRKTRRAPQRIPLASVDGIVLDPLSPTPVRHSHFAVHHVAATSNTREVAQWDQPLIASQHSGRIVLLLHPDHTGVLRARLQIDMSPGLTTSPEWSATVVEPLGTDRELPHYEVLAQVWTSEEGGRFDNWQNEVIIGRTDAPLPTPATASVDLMPDLTLDLTLGALERLVRTPGAVTNELRTAVAVLLSLA
ncbi:MAG: NDP-hexose 2,3-dehydratase family protein [Acidimicrobiia bacterium]